MKREKPFESVIGTMQILLLLVEKINKNFLILRVFLVSYKKNSIEIGALVLELRGHK